MSQVLSILEHNDCRIVSRIFVKGVGEDFDGTSVYASAVQKVITAFDNYIGECADKGIAILDSRNKNKNAPLAHLLFTWGFSSHGHEYNRLAELPVFGHSENHAMIQLADWGRRRSSSRCPPTRIAANTRRAACTSTRPMR